ncbi:MAG: ester cyclase [Acidimicrobiia bacterium]|nr:ester cyclase [Acidimicrobiia bacterium]
MADPQTEETRRIVKRFTLDCEKDFPLTDPSDESWKDRLWELFEELVHPDIVLHGIPGLTRGYRPWYERFVSVGQNFPDGLTTIDVLTAEGDKATMVWTWEGTHIREVMGAPPTGKRVRVQAVMVQRVEKGKIVEHWVGFDSMRWLEQLGLVVDDLSAIGTGHAVSPPSR